MVDSQAMRLQIPFWSFAFSEWKQLTLQGADI